MRPPSRRAESATELACTRDGKPTGAERRANEERRADEERRPAAIQPTGEDRLNSGEHATGAVSGSGTVVIVPTYQEAGTIERLISGLQSAVPDAMVLVIDDASPDGTAALARRAALRADRLTVLERPSKSGLGSAYRDGFRWAQEHGARVVATLDADLSHDPYELPQLLAALDAGADLAIGSRFVAGGSAAGLPPSRRLLSRFVNRLSSSALDTDVKDSTSGFRAYRLRPWLHHAVGDSTSTGFSIQLELARAILERGGEVVEVPIRFEPRAAGHSKLSAAISAEAARKLLRWQLERHRVLDSAPVRPATLLASTRVEAPARQGLSRLAAPEWQLPAVAAALASALAVLVLTLPWRGADYPAQLHRIAFFRQAGFALWDNQWYAGHSTFSYSVVFPPVAALLGAGLTGALSCAVASWCFARVVIRRWGPSASAGALLFASGTVVNLLVGRLSFALGFAFGLMAVAAIGARRRVAAVVFTPLCALASPVAGVFLGLVGAAWALSNTARSSRMQRYRARGRDLVWRRFRSVVRSPGVPLLLGVLIPLACLGILFPDHGRFPLLAGNAAAGLAACALVAWYSSDRALRLGAGLYAVALVATFAVANPLGGNVTRLAAFAAAPVLACLLCQRSRLRRARVGLGHRTVVAATLALFVAWQWLPAASAIAAASGDPSSDRAYYQPLLTFLAAHPADRIEIPFTRGHWETAYVASTVPLARGWQRDLDIAYNPLFYKDALAPGDYRDWLVNNAVQFVALANVAPDPSARQEVAVLQAGVPGLRPVFQSAHWRVWAVDGARPLVEGPGTLVQLRAGSFDVMVNQPGTIVARIHDSPHWTVDGPATVSGSASGWTELRATAPGLLHVHQTLSLWPRSRPSSPDSAD